MNKKWDWDALERQYITGEMSLRELARMNGISNHSAVMRQSKKRGWQDKRAEWRAKAEDHYLTETAEQQGLYLAREDAVRDNAVGAIDDMINQLRGNLKKTKRVMRDGVWVEEPIVIVKPQDIANLIDRLQILFNRPSQITEERSLGVKFASEDPEVLRAIVEATRGISLDGSGSAESPLPSPVGVSED